MQTASNVQFPCFFQKHNKKHWKLHTVLGQIT